MRRLMLILAVLAWFPPRIENVMTRDCVTIKADQLAADVVALMQERAINALLVVDEDGRLQGALNMHTLLRAGVV